MLYIVFSLCSRASIGEQWTWTAAVISLLLGLHVGQLYSIIGRTLGEMIAYTTQCVQRAPQIHVGQHEMLWCCNLFAEQIEEAVLPNEDLKVYVLYKTHRPATSLRCWRGWKKMGCSPSNCLNSTSLRALSCTLSRSLRYDGGQDDHARGEYSISDRIWELYSIAHPLLSSR